MNNDPKTPVKGMNEKAKKVAQARAVLSTKIEDSLLKALSGLDDATWYMSGLATPEDQGNAAILWDCKTRIKAVLQKYDSLSRRRVKS